MAVSDSLSANPLRRPQQHQEIADYLRDEIFAGRLPVGESLPSEAELCEQFSTSRGPVRQAVATLRSEGLISSGRGRRSIVLSSTRTETFEEVLSTSSWLVRMGKVPGQSLKWFGLHPAQPEIAKALQLGAGTSVVSLRRVRTANGVPVVTEDISFSPSISSLVLKIDPNSDSFHRTLMREGVNFNNVARSGSIETANDEDVENLGLALGDPVVVVEVRAFTHTGTPVEYAVRRYRTDDITFGMNSVRGHSSPLWLEMQPEQIG